MNDITNTVNSGLHRGSRVSFKPSRSPSPSCSVSPKRQPLTMTTPPRLQPQESFNSNLSKSQYQQRLQQKRSRLDMIDQHLSSFPLAPPPPMDNEKITEVLRSPDINAYECTSSPASSHVLSEIDPIVLVEDYIPIRSARMKLSVSDLKASLRTFDVDTRTGQENYLTRAKSILETHSEYQSQLQQKKSQQTIRKISQQSSLLLTNTVSSSDMDIDTDMEEPKMPLQELESSKSTEFFSAKTSISPEKPALDIPFEIAHFDFPHADSSSYYAPSFHTIGSISSSLPTLKLSDAFITPTAEFSTKDSRLKSCVICETPLYDISSHCGDAGFVEFVCCNCTEKYETLSKLLETFDEAVSCLHTIPEDVEDIEEALAQPALKKQKNDEFSQTLLDGLKKQLNGEIGATMDRTSALWLLEAKKKLRWRWRISGLLPRFLRRDD